MSPRWQRREFLRAALLQLGAWPLASALGCGRDSRGSNRNDVFEVSPAVRAQVAGLQRDLVLMQHFEGGDRGLVSGIGERYLSAVAPDRSDASVLDALGAALSVLERQISDAEAIEQLRQAINAEFSARVVADLYGWTCAPTELALCALLWIAELTPHTVSLDPADAGTLDEDDAGPNPWR